MWTYTSSYIMAVDDVLVTTNVSVMTRTNQSISFGPLPDRHYLDAPFPISASASSGLPVSFALVSGPAILSGSTNTNTVTLTGAGTVTIQAFQPGNTNYNPAQTNQSFNVYPASDGTVFRDTFAHAGTLSPWVAQLGTWAVTTNYLLQGTNAASGYSYAYVAGNWTNYTLEGQIQFSSTNGYGGGLGGCLQTASGAHYGAWVYPEGSPGGSNVLRLVKFQDWTDFSYTNVIGATMAQASLPSVGTNWHTLKLAFQTNQISVYYDGSLYINTTDVEAQPYLYGGISADMYTDSTPYVMSVSNVTVKLIGR